MSVSFPRPRVRRLSAAAMLVAAVATGSVALAAPASAENSPTSVPIANPDSYGMTMGTTLTVDYASGLLANDLHAADWTTINIVGVQNDVPGELALDGTKGMFSYTPDPAFAGERTFEYQLFDGDLGTHSEWALVTITVVDPSLPCEAGTPGCGPDAPADCLAGDPNCVPPTIPPCDPNGPPMQAPGPGEEPTCIGEPNPGSGGDIPCAAGTPDCGPKSPSDCLAGEPGCVPPVIPPCDPDGAPMEAPGPGEDPACIGEPGPGDGSDIPCAAGAPGCGPDETVPDGTVPNGTVPDPTDTGTGTDTGTSTNTTELPTLAYTGAAVDFRLAALAAVLLVGGVILVLPRRRTA